MIYIFWCEECKEEIEESFQMGKVPKSIKCPNCNKVIHRQYTTPSIHVQGGTRNIVSTVSPSGESSLEGIRQAKREHKIKS